jgi:hypothetical protein
MLRARLNRPLTERPSNVAAKPSSGSHPRTPKRGYSQTRESQTAPVDPRRRGCLVPGWVRRSTVTRPKAIALGTVLPRSLRRTSSAPPRGLVQATPVLRSPDVGRQRSQWFGASGTTRELRILPRATAAQRPEHELVSRMFLTNGDSRSLVPPMQSAQYSFDHSRSDRSCLRTFSTRSVKRLGTAHKSI